MGLVNQWIKIWIVHWETELHKHGHKTGRTFLNILLVVDWLISIRTVFMGFFCVLSIGEQLLYNILTALCVYQQSGPYICYDPHFFTSGFQYSQILEKRTRSSAAGVHSLQGSKCVFSEGLQYSNASQSGCGLCQLKIAILLWPTYSQ